VSIEFINSNISATIFYSSAIFLNRKTNLTLFNIEWEKSLSGLLFRSVYDFVPV